MVSDATFRVILSKSPWDVWEDIDAAITLALKNYPTCYLQIKKVHSSPFRLEVKWLVPDPESPEEIAWVEEGLPVACGKFKPLAQNHPVANFITYNLNFSHQIAYVKDGNMVFIYPKKGEIWALYKDWDIKWSSNPESHMEFKYEIVEVLSDFDKEHGILVAYMVKVEGFVSVFCRTSRVRLAECCIPSSELFRFSHNISSLKLAGKERADVPIGSFELDTHACFHSSGSDSDRKTCCIQRSPRGFKRNLQNSVGKGQS
ncbi:DnaJ domain-containing protein, partial [Tanacetum coccineum]